MLPGVLFVGYFLSGASRGRCVCEDLSERFRERGYPVTTTSARLNRYSRLVDMVSTIIFRSGEYQVASVEVYNGWAFVWAEMACYTLRLLRKPCVISLHGARLLEFAQRWPARVQRLLQRADLVTTPSRLFQREFRSMRSDIVYLPNGIDAKAIQFRQRDHPEPRLGWLRRFERNYNPVLALETVAQLVADFPSIRLVMSGAEGQDGALSDVRRCAAELGLMPHLEITDFVPRAQIASWFGRSDIYLNTTNVESFGIAVMEAAAAGLCIVTTDAGELTHLWNNDHDALVVPRDDPTAMASAVRRIVTEPGLASYLSANARAKAEHYDWSVIVPEWEALFQRLQVNG